MNKKKYSLKWQNISHMDNVKPFTIADMEFNTPKFIVDNLVNFLKIYPLTYFFKTDDIYNSIIKWQWDNHKLKIDLNNILFFNSTITCLCLLIKVFSKENENILLFDPEYGHFVDVIKNLKRNIVFFKLNIDNKYIINFKKLEKIIIDKKIKIIIISNPNNPSGKVYNYNELKKISILCNKYNIIFISDEIHQDICLDTKHLTALNINKKSIVLVSVTKTFNISGIKTSICLIKNKKIKEKLEKYQIDNCYNIINNLGLIATKICYESGQDWKNKLLKTIKENRYHSLKYINMKMPELKVYPSESTYFLWINYSSLNIKESEFLNLLIKIGKIQVTEGSYFGKHSNQYIRVNIACDKSYLNFFLQSLEKVVNYIKELNSLK